MKINRWTGGFIHRSPNLITIAIPVPSGHLLSRACLSVWLFLCLPCILPARPVVVLLTDFGLENEAVGVCKGAILSIDANIEVVDLCHTVEPYNIRKASLMLKRSTSFPRGSVITVVVDPGVGTARTGIALRTHQGLFFVAPDNGVLSEVIRRQGVECAVRLEEKRVNPNWKPGTFDGRDLFSPAAAWLASTSGDLNRIGTPISVTDIQLLPEIRAKVDTEKNVIDGHYLLTDEPYGNIWTDITTADLEAIGCQLGDQIFVKAGDQEQALPWVVSFGHVPEGKPLAYIASGDTLALAINMGDFRKTWKLEEGCTITVRKGIQR